MKPKTPTIFLDVDGTIVKHNYTPEHNGDIFLPGAPEKMNEWSERGFTIIFTTARTPEESYLVRKTIETCLGKEFRWIYNLGTGPRYLINDHDGDIAKAMAINVKRNVGLENVTI